MATARCAACESTIKRMRAHGYQYTAMQAYDFGPWYVAFLGADPRRGTGATLHAAIEEAARC